MIVKFIILPDKIINKISIVFKIESPNNVYPQLGDGLVISDFVDQSKLMPTQITQITVFPHHQVDRVFWNLIEGVLQPTIYCSVPAKILSNYKKKTSNKEYTPAESDESKLTEKDKEDWRIWKEWIVKNAPEVLKMKKPLDAFGLAKLKSLYSNDLIKKKLGAIQNTPNIHASNADAFLTLNNWCSRDFGYTNKTQKPQESYGDQFKK